MLFFKKKRLYPFPCLDFFSKKPKFSKKSENFRKKSGKIQKICPDRQNLDPGILDRKIRKSKNPKIGLDRQDRILDLEIGKNCPDRQNLDPEILDRKIRKSKNWSRPTRSDPGIQDQGLENPESRDPKIFV